MTQLAGIEWSMDSLTAVVIMDDQISDWDMGFVARDEFKEPEKLELIIGPLGIAIFDSLKELRGRGGLLIRTARISTYELEVELRVLPDSTDIDKIADAVKSALAANAVNAS